MVDVKKVKEQALEEVRREKETEAKDRLKYKFEELAKAEKVVKNIQREIEDLEDELSQDN